MSCPSIECCLFVQCRRFLWAQCSSFYFMKFYDMVVPSAFFPAFLPSPHAVSDGAVCLRKFHRLLHNLLIINVDKFLQRGRILIVRKSGCYTYLKQSERAAFLYGIRSYRIQIDDCFPIFYLNLYCLYCFSRSEVENYGTYICRILAPRRFLKNSFDDNI